MDPSISAAEPVTNSVGPALGSTALGSKPRFSCRIVYLQATSEGPESVADHWQAEGEDHLVCYQTTSW